ncbi:MAG TPA: hypothetical protein VN950_19085 [Terriglobales bacterium]|nr:hypothetical protein [Terriglobales bacterium]
MDNLDTRIKAAAEALHEAGRQQAISRRHRRDRESETRLAFDQMMERVLLHFPLPKRERYSSPKEFEKHFLAAMQHRLQLVITILSESNDGDDVNPYENTRLTF